MRAQLSHPLVVRVVPPLLLVVACLAWFVALLTLHPYEGLYGQDSYAYYYQARSLWQEISGQVVPSDQLFSAQALRWPVGYHLHIIAGIILSGGPAGGRLITLAMAAVAPALIYLIVAHLWIGVSPLTRLIAGLVGGVVLPLTATYVRMGLSLMSDVPAVFWMTLAVLCFLRAWPLARITNYQLRTTELAWAGLAGGALGLAVLTRYGSILLAAPMLVYLALLKRRDGSWKTTFRADLARGGVATLAFALTMLPQMAYYASPLAVAPPGAVDYRVWLSDWKLSNIFASSFSSADGTASYAHPNIVFYMVQPFWTPTAEALSLSFWSPREGLLSIFFLPPFLLGVWVLVVKRCWPVLGLLLTWWLMPVIFFSGSPYQSHRFVLVYLPALAILIGLGCATTLNWLRRAIWLRPQRGMGVAHIMFALALLCSCGGTLVGAVSVGRWMATHARFEAQEKHVAELVRQAAVLAPLDGPPRVVSFNITAAIYHYTQWPMLDFYNHDEREIGQFLQGAGPRILVLPEKSMSTQWAGKPSSARWEWMRQTYDLTLVGESGEYRVYRLGNRR